MAAAFNFIGAFAGTAVAKTIGAGMVDEHDHDAGGRGRALIGAIVWNLITWWLGLPSSSAMRSSAGCWARRSSRSARGAIKVEGVVNKVLIPLVSSPVIGFIGALSADDRPVLDRSG